MPESRAEELSRVALANIEREFPHYEPLLQTEPRPAERPRELHPSFYGSFDWHSCVGMHWMLVRLLRAVPERVPEAETRAALSEGLAAERLATEAGYFADPVRPTIERPYGWGWALKLVQEVATWQDADAARWARSLQPLADVFVARYLAWLPSATYPVRHGVHTNSAFGLSLGSRSRARWPIAASRACSRPLPRPRLAGSFRTTTTRRSGSRPARTSSHPR